MPKALNNEVLHVRLPAVMLARLDAFVEARRGEEMTRARATRILLDEALERWSGRTR